MVIKAPVPVAVAGIPKAPLCRCDCCVIELQCQSSCKFQNIDYSVVLERCPQSPTTRRRRRQRPQGKLPRKPNSRRMLASQKKKEMQDKRAADKEKKSGGYINS